MQDSTPQDQVPQISKKKKAEEAALKRSQKKTGQKQKKAQRSTITKDRVEDHEDSVGERSFDQSEDEYLDAEQSEPEEEQSIKK